MVRPPRKKGSQEVSVDKARTGRRAGLRPKLLLMFGSIVIALIVGETGVRLTGRAPEIIPIGISSDRHVYRRSTNPILSYEFKPGFRSDAENLPFDYRVINSHGLRDIEREFAKPPGTKRIILLGDSVVVGYRVREIDHLMSRRLEMLYGDEKVEVINLAVTGYCTLAEVEFLRVQGLKYDPDAVILVFVENDFRNFNPESIGADGIVNRPAAASWMFKKSHIFRLACLEFNWFSFGIEADPVRWNPDAIGDNNVVEGLKLLRKLADEHGFNPLVAVWPAFGNDRIEYPAKMWMPDSRELIVERLARCCGVPAVGLREAFVNHWKQQPSRPVPREYYSVGDEMHPSVVGHRVAAEIFHGVVDEYRLLEPADRRSARVARPAQDDAAVRAAMAQGTEKAGYGLYFINRAVTSIQEGKPEEALRQLDKALSSDPLYYGEASAMMASVLVRQGKTEKAISRLQKALEVEPNHFQARMLLGSLLRTGNAHGEAIKHLRHAVALKPDSYDGHYHLGLAFAQCGRWKEAEEQFRAAVRLRPNDSAAGRLLKRCIDELNLKNKEVAK